MIFWIVLDYKDISGRIEPQISGAIHPDNILSYSMQESATSQRSTRQTDQENDGWMLYQSRQGPTVDPPGLHQPPPQVLEVIGDHAQPYLI